MAPCSLYSPPNHHHYHHAILLSSSRSFSPSVRSSPRQANGNQQLQGESLGVLVGQRGASGSRGVTVLVKSSQGLCCRGIASPFKDCMVTSMHPSPPPLTPLRLPLAPLFLGSQGSRQPRVNKVIPGVGQRAPPPFSSSLLTPTSSTLWAPHFTPLNPAGTSSLRASLVGRGGQACQNKSKPQVSCRTCPLCVCVHV